MNSIAKESLFSDGVMLPEKLAYQESDVSSTINSYLKANAVWEQDTGSPEHININKAAHPIIPQINGIGALLLD